MIELLGKAEIDGRELFYTNILANGRWYEELPDENWTGFIICDSKEVPFISEIVNKCLDKNIGYVCCAGKACELMHDIFQEEKVYRHVILQVGLNVDPMTSWHYNFSQGFWFSMYCAFDEDKNLDKIVCIDCTERGINKFLSELLKKINNKWLPSDEKVEEPQYDKE